MSPDDPRHGSTAGYHAGCRGASCRRAMALYEKRGRLLRQEGRSRAIPALGTQRRIRGLMFLGWTSTDIALAAGWNHRNSVLQILHGQDGRPCTWTTRDAYTRIGDTYDRLSMTPPPMTPVRARTRAIAARRGYTPPLGWDDIDRDDAPSAGSAAELDPVVVLRLLDGEQITSTRAEKDEAMRRWLSMGNSEQSLCAKHSWRGGRYGKAS